MTASKINQATSNDVLLNTDFDGQAHTPKVIVSSGTMTSSGSTGAGATDATTARVVLASDGTVLGPVTETAPATDIASSGLNGRLQRIAQRLTSLIAQIPATLGQKTAAASMAVVLSSDVNTVTLGAGTAKVGTVKERYFSVVFSTLTRPANTTAYSANDSISDNATAGSVTAIPCTTASDVADAPIAVTEVLLDTNDTGLAAGTSVRAYLFGSDPTASSGVGGGDNAAYSQKKLGFLGSLSGTFRAFSDGGKARLVPDEGTSIVMNPSSAGTTIWIQYQTLAAFTPSANSTTIDARLRGFQGSA